MNLNQLRAFAHLSRTLHYQRTAEALGISQPALSRTIRALEDPDAFRVFYLVTSLNRALSPQAKSFYRFVLEESREQKQELLAE